MRLSSIKGVKARQIPKFTTSFNANLPVVIKVLEKVGFNRYRLKIGNKEMTTKSQKKLEVHTKYWGELYTSQYETITVKNLYTQPYIMQNDEYFLEEKGINAIEYMLEQNSLDWYHSWLLNSLSEANNKEEFKTFSYMLLALNEEVIFFPIKINERLFIFQWKYLQTLNSFWIDFYLAFENLGPICGKLNIKEKELKLKAVFAKTAYWLGKSNNFVELHSNISPLWESNKSLLDLKG